MQERPDESFWRDVREVDARLEPYYSTAERFRWLSSPHPQLEGATACDALLDGDGDKVHAIIDRLDADNYL